MKIIEAYAHILTSNSSNAKNINISLEGYVLSSRRWVRLISAKTNSKGIWQVKTLKLKSEAPYAPQLRLIETESSNVNPRVLTQTAFLSYNSTAQTLFVDFGQVQQLEQASYPLKFSNRRFGRSKLTVAGQPKKMVILAVAATNFNLNTTTTAITHAAALEAANVANKIKTSQAVLDSFNVEYLKFQANETRLNSTIIQKDQLLATKSIEINDNKTRIKSLETQLNKMVESEKQLKIDNQVFISEAKRKTSIQDIASNIGAEIDAANRIMRDKKQPYQFGRIELDLRGTISNDGNTMSMIGISELTKLKNGVTSPSVKLELIPEYEQTETASTIKTPDVIGLTETAARRLLQAVGLQLQSISKSISTDAKIPIGLSIQQAPKANTAISIGSTILVVFSASSSNSEEQA